MGDIPNTIQERLQEFRGRSAEFEAKLRNGKVTWNYQNSFDMFLYIMDKKGYTEPQELKRIDFKISGLRDFSGIYNNKRYNNEFRAAINDIVDKTLNPPDNSKEIKTLEMIATHLQKFKGEEMEEFDALLKSGKIFKWVLESRYKMLLYIMAIKNYSNPRQITAKDFVLDFKNFQGVYQRHKSHITMIELTVNNTLFPEESDEIFTINANGETDPNKLFQMYLDKFKVEKKEDFIQYLNSGKGICWDTENRFLLTLLVCDEKKYKNVCTIKQTDYETNYGNFRAAFNEYGGKHKLMIREIFSKKGIVFENNEDMMTLAEKKKFRQQYLDNVPMFDTNSITDDQWNAYHISKKIINNLSNIISDGLKEIHIDTSYKLGVSYVIWDVNTKNVLYVGSTDEFAERKKNHFKNCFHPNASDYNKPIYIYIRERYSNWDYLDIIPLVSCPVGFELFVEAALYNLLKHKYTLFNGQVPTYSSIDDIGYIYWFRKIMNNEKFYVGSTNDFYKRRDIHWSHCYLDLKQYVKKEAYQVIREIDSVKFPKDKVAIEAIEKMPIWIMKEREQYYIDLYGISNSADAFNPSTEIRSEKRKAHNNEKVECQICYVKLNRNGMLRHLGRCHVPNIILDKQPSSPCKICGVVITPERMLNHLCKVHSPNFDHIKNKIQCPVCNKEITKDHMMRHKITMHRPNFDAVN